MNPTLLAEVARRLCSGRFIGGGTAIRPDRWSPGIALTGLFLLAVCMWEGVSGGAIWCQAEDFHSLGGFDESLCSVEDLDFCRRLRALGRGRHQRFGTILRAGIVTSARKFDRFGDWYLLTHPGLVRAIFTGRSKAAADLFYYDVDRP